MAIGDLITVIKKIKFFLFETWHPFIYYDWSIILLHHLNCVTFITYVHLSNIREQMVSIPIVLCPLAVIP